MNKYGKVNRIYYCDNFRIVMANSETFTRRIKAERCIQNIIQYNHNCTSESCYRFVYAIFKFGRFQIFDGSSKFNNLAVSTTLLGFGYY